MATTSIEWTATVHPDGTVTPGRVWNPVTGCTKVSPGCKHCYAETIADRFWKTQYPQVIERVAEKDSADYPTSSQYSRPRRFTDVQCHEDRLLEPLSWRKPARVFVNSMSDLFHEDVPDAFIDRVFAVMALAPRHTFQILTKRAERMRDYCSDPAVAARVARAADKMAVEREVADLKEEVLPIPGYDGYYASNLGTILTAKRGETKPMSPDEGEAGHLRVQLHREGAGKRGDRLLVHRLILETFIGPPPTPDAQACHRDGNPRNNALPNLRWGTQAENWVDRKRHGNAQSWSRLTLQEVEDIKGFRKAGMTQANVAARFGISDTQVRNIEKGLQWAEASEWPLRNVWKGVSCEDQPRYDQRIGHLLRTPAAVRFISYEPALGPLDLRLGGMSMPDYSAHDPLPQIDWLIAGGESGHGARPCALEWIERIVEQCRAASVPVFVKQLGAFVVSEQRTCDQEMVGLLKPRSAARMVQAPNGEYWAWRAGLTHGKGGDPAEWPAHLRVREFPRGQP